MLGSKCNIISTLIIQILGICLLFDLKKGHKVSPILAMTVGFSIEITRWFTMFLVQAASRIVAYSKKK